MKLEYCMDISENSLSFPHTPGLDFRGLPFYLASWGHFYANKDYFTEREGWDEYLLFYTVSGSGLLQYRDVEYLLRPGQVAIIYCHEYQFYKTVSEVPWEFKWIHFNGSAAREYFNMINDNSLKIIELADTTELNQYIEKIAQATSSRDVVADISVSLYLTNIMTMILINKYKPVSNSRYLQHSSDINKVTDYIHSNYSSKISTDDLLELVHLSKYHFLRIFKKYTGKSPYEYLINYRINQSKILLKDTTFSVNEISFKVGYGNTNNFIRDFKKYVGLTPHKYRRFVIN